MTYRVANLVTAGILLCLGIVLAVDTYRLGAGWGMEGPKPGFFPLIMSVIVIVGCVVIIRRVVTKPDKKASEPFVTAETLKPVLIVLVPACLMVLFIEVVGLYVAAIVYLVAYIRWVGHFRWPTVLAVGILVPLFFYILFERVFLIPMPSGMYGNVLIPF
jgi:putative tricarboxylic transport membrane protein